MTNLSAADKHDIARARELAALTGVDSIRQHFGEDDGYMAMAAAFGSAQEVLRSLASLAERLGEDGGQR